MADKSSDFLVVEDPEKASTWHLQVKKDGAPDHGLMGAAWAALHGGYRGNKYEGPGKSEALSKLIALYKAEKMPLPGEKSVDLEALEDELKIGARNNAGDQKRIQSIHDMAAACGATCGEVNGDAIPAPKAFPDDTLVAFGDEVKALGQGRVGGYLVRFGSPTKTDLTGDYFTPETDFGKNTRTDVYYHHGLDTKLGKRVIGEGAMKIDDIGVWVEAQLSMRDEYEKAVYELVENGKAGWSSGTAAHLVERKAVGSALEITRWILGLDASITPTPAEYRNKAIPLKSLQAETAALDSATDASEPHHFMEIKGVTHMDEKELKRLEAIEKFMADQESARKAKDESEHIQVEAKKIAEEQIKARMAELGIPEGGPSLKAFEAAERKAIKHLGTPEYGTAFKTWLRTGNENAIKSLFESTDTAGGFLVPEEWQAEILKKIPGLTAVYQLADKKPASRDTLVLFKRIYAASDKYTAGTRLTWTGDVPASATTARVTSNAYGQARIPIHVAMATELVYRSLLEDAVVQVEADLRSTFAENVVQDLEYYFCQGTGNNQPYGLFSDVTAIASAASSGSVSGSLTYVSADGLKNVYFQVPAQYRTTASWVFNSNAASYIARLKDNNSRYIWDDGPFGGGLATQQPDGIVTKQPLLLGRPVYITEQSPNIAANVYWGAFGAISGYKVAERVGMSIVRLDEIYAETDAVAFVLRVRMGGQLVEDYKLRLMVGAA